MRSLYRVRVRVGVRVRVRDRNRVRVRVRGRGRHHLLITNVSNVSLFFIVLTVYFLCIKIWKECGKRGSFVVVAPRHVVSFHFFN